MMRLPTALRSLAIAAFILFSACAGPALAQDASVSGTKGKIGRGDVDLPSLRAVLQARITGRCGPRQAIKRIARDGKVTCSMPGPRVTSIATSGGITGGGSNGVTLGVDSSMLQSRINGGCDGHRAMQSVNRDGTVQCLDTGTGGGSVTSVKSGFGLTGGPITDDGTLAADPTVLQSRITSDCSGRETIQTVKQDGSVTCQASSGGSVTSVGSGFGLTGGPITDSGSLAVDPTAVQNRVTGTCTTNQFLKSILQDGTVTCGSAVTGVTAGTGLSGGTINDTGTISVNPAAVQSRISGACTTNQAVKSVAQDGTVGCGSFVTGVTAGTGLTGGTVSNSGTIAVDPAAVQNRVSGTCPSTQAVQGVNQDGTVACSGGFASAAAGVKTASVSAANGQQTTLFSVDGVNVVLDCSDGTNAKLSFGTGGAFGINVVGNDDANTAIRFNSFSSGTFDVLSTATTTRGDTTVTPYNGPSQNAVLNVSAVVLKATNGPCRGFGTLIGG